MTYRVESNTLAFIVLYMLRTCSDIEVIALRHIVVPTFQNTSNKPEELGALISLSNTAPIYTKDDVVDQIPCPVVLATILHFVNQNMSGIELSSFRVE